MQSITQLNYLNKAYEFIGAKYDDIAGTVVDHTKLISETMYQTLMIPYKDQHLVDVIMRSQPRDLAKIPRPGSLMIKDVCGPVSLIDPYSDAAIAPCGNKSNKIVIKYFSYIFSNIKVWTYVIFRTDTLEIIIKQYFVDLNLFSTQCNHCIRVRINLRYPDRRHL